MFNLDELRYLINDRFLSLLIEIHIKIKIKNENNN